MNFAEICNADTGRVSIRSIPPRGWPLTAELEAWRIPEHFRLPPEPEAQAHARELMDGKRLPANGTMTRRVYDLLASFRGEQFTYADLSELMNVGHSISTLLASLKRSKLIKSRGPHSRMIWWAP